MREIFRENTTFPFLPTCEAITQYKTLHTKFVKRHYIQSARSADNMLVASGQKLIHSHYHRNPTTLMEIPISGSHLIRRPCLKLYTRLSMPEWSIFKTNEKILLHV